MTRVRRTIVVATGSVLLVLTGGASVVTAADGSLRDDAEPAISGDALTRASQAALAVTGGGRVTDTEVGDEDSYYEVEVTLDDGHKVDVQLDTSFHEVGTSSDVEHPDGTAGH